MMCNPVSRQWEGVLSIGLPPGLFGFVDRETAPENVSKLRCRSTGVGGADVKQFGASYQCLERQRSGWVKNGS